MSGLPTSRLAELATAISVSKGFLTAKTADIGDVPVLSVAMLRNGAPAKRFTDRETIDDLGLGLAAPCDVLVAIEGGTVGESLIVADGHPAFIASQQVATLRVTDSSVIDSWYLGAWMATDAARDQLRRLARGASIQRVPMKDLSNLTLPLPPLAQQRSIGERYRAFEESISGHRAIVTCLEQLREVDLDTAFAELDSSQVGPGVS